MTGRLWLEDGVVHNRSTQFGDWDIALADVRMIGEATNEDGPFLDDWMLVFATGPDRWYEASFYATIHTDFREKLGEVLHAPLAAALAGSASFDSRVLWPPHLVGRPVFVYEHGRAKTLFGRIASRVVGPLSCTQRFTDEVVAHLSKA